MFLCFNINNVIDKTVDLVGAAILSNLLHLSMLRKPDVTSLVSQTVFVGTFYCGGVKFFCYVTIGKIAIQIIIMDTCRIAAGA